MSVRLAIGKPNTAEQFTLQKQIVDILKGNGAATVGISFEELPKETIEKYQPAVAEEDKTILTEAHKTNFIAIASGKGGVGKSTVTVNLAMALMRIGKKVGIIDADIYGFSIPVMMGIDELPKTRGEKIFPVERFGVKVMSMGFFAEDNSPIVWRGPMLGKAINIFFKEVEWGDLDYLLLDLPPGTGDIAMDVHALLPTCNEIIVTTPHPTAAFVAARAGQMAINTDHEILGVIENMAYYENSATNEKEYLFGRGGGDRLAESLRTNVIGRLPLEQPYEEEDEEDYFAPAIYQEEHPNGKEYHRMAAKIIAAIEEKKEAEANQTE